MFTLANQKHDSLANSIDASMRHVNTKVTIISSLASESSLKLHLFPQHHDLRRSSRHTTPDLDMPPWPSLSKHSNRQVLRALVRRCWALSPRTEVFVHVRSLTVLFLCHSQSPRMDSPSAFAEISMRDSCSRYDAQVWTWNSSCSTRD
jgi:hypothetical protein